MATPIPDSYASASGKPIYAGRLAPVAEVIDQQYGKYRYQSPQLFQTAAAAVYPTRVSGGADLDLDTNSPRYYFVANGWKWDTPGGDWIDATGTRQGVVSWINLNADKVSGSNAIASYSTDCTAIMQYIQANNRWNAMYMSCQASRSLAGVFSTTQPKPVINVVYVGGATETLACTTTARSTLGSSTPISTTEAIGLPAFLEFKRPAAPIQSATLEFTFVTHWADGGPAVSLYVLDPPINTNPTVMGIANTAELDVGLPSDPSIIGVHRYVDGVSLSSFTETSPAVSSASAFDPYIYQGSPTHDYTKLPHRGLGKFINPPAEWAMVTSAYSGEGFEALAPGMGALKVPMLHNPEVVDGFNNNKYGGTSGSAAYIFMPEPLFGYLDHIFVRYYMRIGTPNGRPYRMPKDQMYQMSQAPGTAWLWPNVSGKTGITPSHMTTQGGNSGGSGGGWGWEMRHSWSDCVSDDNGPEVGGWQMGMHLDDYKDHNPPGHWYCGACTNSIDESWNQKGGLGGTLLADKWYCVETELKLNTVFPEAPGYTPDGIIRVWVDGRLTYEQTEKVFRSLPLMADTGPNPPYNPAYMIPIRELGVKALWFNWYHGGMTQNTILRTMFVTGVAWGTEYIGPMKLPAPALPSWVPTTSNTLANVPELNTYMSLAPTVDSPPGGWSYNYLGNLASESRTLQFGKVIDDFSGGVYNPYLGALGSFIFHGGGHAATRWNGVVVYDVATQLYSVWMAASDVCDPLDHANTEYADGQPMSAHTYDSCVIIGPEAGYPKGALLTPIRMAAEPFYSDSSTAAHLFDFNNPGAKFVRLAASNGWGISPGGAAAYDPDLGRVWWVMNQNKNGYQEYFDLSDHTQKRYMFGGYPPSLGPPEPNTQHMRYDKARKLLICTYTLSGTSTRNVSYLETTNLAAGWKEATLSTAIPAGNGSFDKAGNGWYYMITTGDAGRLWRFQVPATLSDTWTAEPITPAGAAINSNNIMGKRFSYVPALDAIMFKAKSGVSHQIYRP